MIPLESSARAMTLIALPSALWVTEYASAGSAVGSAASRMSRAACASAVRGRWRWPSGRHRPWYESGAGPCRRARSPPVVPGQKRVSDVREVSRGDFALDAHLVAGVLGNPCRTPPLHSRDVQFR